MHVDPITGGASFCKQPKDADRISKCKACGSVDRFKNAVSLVNIELCAKQSESVGAVLGVFQTQSLDAQIGSARMMK